MTDDHSRSGTGVSPFVPAGLFAAWLANDIEEWFTMDRWARWHHAEIEAVPPLRRAIVDPDQDPHHNRTAIVLTGGVVLTASIRGVQTDGRSGFFQAALFAFGIHGFTHLASSALVRGYTPGVATAPTVVLPYSAWALRRLRSADVLRSDRRTWATGVALLPATLVGVHGAAKLIGKARRRVRSRSGRS